MSKETPRYKLSMLHPYPILNDHDLNITNKSVDIFSPGNSRIIEDKQNNIKTESIDNDKKEYFSTVCNVSIPNDTDQNICHIVETTFNTILHKLSKRDRTGKLLTNKIDYISERYMIIEYGNKIHSSQQYPELTIYQVYLVLVFIYYGVHLIEPCSDLLSFIHLRSYFNNKQFVCGRNLLYDITGKDVLIQEDENISRSIRRAFMGFTE